MRLSRLLIALMFSAFACAADRALLIGVGEFDNPEITPLPGIAQDVAGHAMVLRNLGFRPDDIHTLLNREATYSRIQAEIKQWLATARATDRVVVYFSGHGSLSRDREGRTIAVLLAYDTRVGNGRLDNVVSGPELASLVISLPSRTVLILADACHSGRMTDGAKGMRGEVAKFWTYPGMPVGNDDFTMMAKDIRVERDSNFLLFAACGREESATATPQGSLMSLAFSRAVYDLLRAREPVTMQDAYPRVMSLLNGREQHPELSGNDVLRRLNWARAGAGAGGSPAPRLPPPPNATGPAPSIGGGDWEFLRSVYEKREGDVPVTLSKPSFRNKDTLTLQIDIPTKGYLNVVTVSSRDSVATVLFPNKYTQDNRVEAGPLRLPNESSYVFSQEIEGKAEDNELIVLFTTEELNLYKGGTGKDAFRQLNPSTRGTVVRKASGIRAGFVRYRINP